MPRNARSGDAPRSPCSPSRPAPVRSRRSLNTGWPPDDDDGGPARILALPQPRQGVARGNGERVTDDRGEVSDECARTMRVRKDEQHRVDAPSRCLIRSRRSVACASEGALSNSTPSRRSGPDTIPSHARRSSGIGNGISVAQRSAGRRCERNAATSGSCALSRIASPPGNSFRLRSRPRTAAIRASRSTETPGPPRAPRG